MCRRLQRSGMDSGKHCVVSLNGLTVSMQPRHVTAFKVTAKRKKPNSSDGNLPLTHFHVHEKKNASNSPPPPVNGLTHYLIKSM